AGTDCSQHNIHKAVTTSDTFWSGTNLPACTVCITFFHADLCIWARHAPYFPCRQGTYGLGMHPVFSMHMWHIHALIQYRSAPKLAGIHGSPGLCCTDVTHM